MAREQVAGSLSFVKAPMFRKQGDKAHVTPLSRALRFLERKHNLNITTSGCRIIG